MNRPERATGSPRDRTDPPPRNASSSPSWERVLDLLDATERTELLEAAERAGFVLLPSLPSANPNKPPDNPLPLRLLDIEELDLPPVLETECAWVDSELDEDQREAIRLALATPDLCLISGESGSGKSRAAAELIRQMALRTARVLLVAPEGAGSDRVLHLLKGSAELCIVRCCGKNEVLEHLPEEVRSLTPEEREKRFREETLERARRQVGLVRSRLKNRRQTEKVWETLEHLARCQEKLNAQREEADREHARAKEALEQALREEESDDSDDPRLSKLAKLNRVAKKTLGKLRTQAEKARSAAEGKQNEREAVERELSALRPMAEARASGSWLSLSFWKAKLSSARLEQYEELLAHEKELQGQLEQTRAEVGQAEEALRAEEESHRKQREELLEEERARPDREHERALTLLDQEAGLIEHQWNEACALLDEGVPRPSAVSANALDEAKSAWERFQSQGEDNLRRAKERAETFKELAQSFGRRVVSLANVVAATPAGLARLADQRFDWLIVEDADRISEEALAEAAKLCPRHVLIGTRSQITEPTPFSKLWEKLSPTPKSGLVQWGKTEDRLCCRLFPLSSEQQQWIEIEPVVDRTDVDLHILVEPDADPRLAAVHFPLDTTLHEAKEYLYQELEEITAQSHSTSIRWEEGEEHLFAKMNGCEIEEAVVVPLEPGVAELVCEEESPSSLLFETLGFRFAKAQGWSREKAEEWLTQQLGPTSYGRTAELSRLHRQSSGLARFLQSDEPEACEGVVLVRADETASGEVDLSDSQARTRLPKELGSIFLERGLVNYEEAKAVVEHLERLLSDPELRTRAVEWQERAGAVPCVPESTKKPVRTCASPTIAVTAPYPSQAQLIQHLLRQSRSLASGETHLTVAPPKPECARRTDYFAVLECPEGRISLEVDVPESLRQRECFLLILSLTRGGSEAPPRLTECPRSLYQMLTRPAEMLRVHADGRWLERCAEAEGEHDLSRRTARRMLVQAGPEASRSPALSSEAL